MTQRHKVSKYCWKNGVHRFRWCRVATDLQFGGKKHKWNAVSAKYDKVKNNKLRYVCMFPFGVKSVLPQQAWCSHCMWKNGQRIHVFEGCLIWIQLVKSPGKISKKPQMQECISFSIFPCIIMKNKLHGVRSGTSWLSQSIAGLCSKEPSPVQCQRGVFFINAG